MTYAPIQGKCPVCHQDSANTAFQAGAESRDAEVAELRDQVAMLRKGFTDILTDTCEKFPGQRMIQIMSICNEALTATADLDKYILCEKEPSIETAASGKPYVVGEAPPQTYFYRAKEQGK